MVNFVSFHFNVLFSCLVGIEDSRLTVFGWVLRFVSF